jgi:hypothetical protein
MSGPSVTLQAQPGDVISSPAFVQGLASVDNQVVLVGNPRGVSIKFQVDRDDPTRVDARFLVEQAFWWQPMKGARKLPRAWRVRARRLERGGTYDPEGELIVFHQKPEGPHAFAIERVLRHGRYELFKVDDEVVIVNGEHVSRIRERKAKAREKAR